MFALEQWQPGPDELSFLNVVTGVGLTIRELVESVANVFGFSGTIELDTSKSDVTPKIHFDVVTFRAWADLRGHLCRRD